MKKEHTKFNKGFTLVESLVAIAILSLSVAATFTAVQTGLKSSLTAKDQITAFYLTQEAMEFIKNMRDENALHDISGTPTNWLSAMSNMSTDACFFGKTCIIDSALSTITTCSGGFGSCPDLNQDTSTGLFTYASTGSTVVTTFKREIQFQSVSAYEVNVIIKTSWVSGGVNKTFQISETLFDRQ